MHQKLTLFTICLAFTVIILGGYTRLTDAGLGCPDWPGCYGQILAPTSQSEISNANSAYPDAPVDVPKAWTEMVHRYFASTLGLLIVALAIVTHFSKTAQSSERWLTRGLVALVLFQGLLGMWTVTLKLFPLVVMSHLLGGLLTLSLLWTLWHKQHPPKVNTHPASPRTLVGITIAALFFQIALGGWTSTNYAALSCPSFPFCTQTLLPQFDWQAFDLFGALAFENPLTYLSNEARQTIHMFHRFGALMLTLLILVCCGALLKYHARTSNIRRMPKLVWGLATLLVIQLGLGITNVVALLPLKVAMLHHGTAVVLLLLMLHIFFSLPKKAMHG